ncbi:hypothetical protein GCM10009854_06280 [Saccharopolyspora halophila]|uniref:TetR family transcriptional regulator n=1 Tax=Saccharopolyspora halophila TaxID=405551 RepID=A0ABN3FMG7_9PSEU
MAFEPAQVNAAVEIANPEHPAFAVVTEHKRRLGQRLAELVAEAGIPEPEQVAADIVVIYEGTITALLLDLDSAPFERARRLAGEALRAAGL